VTDDKATIKLSAFAEEKIKKVLPWKEQPENKEIWKEALEGYRNGIPAVVIAEWLQTEHECPLMTDSIRKGLRQSRENIE